MSSLRGLRVAILEGRMTSELANLVRRYEGMPYSVPAVREAALDCGEDVESFINGLSQGSTSVVVFLTGVGVTALLCEAERLRRLRELLSGLSNATIVCRGPKPMAVLTRNGLCPSINAREPYTTTELLEAMAGLELKDRGVALIHYGERNQVLAEALQIRGARLKELCLYEWLMPEELGPLKALVREIISGRVGAIAFTSQIQVRHLFQVAAGLGLEGDLVEALSTKTIVVSVGPTCTAVLQGFQIKPHVVPEHPKMGSMISALAQHIEREKRRASRQQQNIITNRGDQS